MGLITPFSGTPSTETPALADHGAAGGELAAPFDIGSVVGALSASPATGGAPSVNATETGAAGGSAWSGILKWLGVPNIADVIGLILGLLLIAAGIFLFRPVREAATEAVKTGVKAAAVA